MTAFVKNRAAFYSPGTTGLTPSPQYRALQRSQEVIKANGDCWVGSGPGLESPIEDQLLSHLPISPPYLMGLNWKNIFLSNNKKSHSPFQSIGFGFLSPGIARWLSIGKLRIEFIMSIPRYRIRHQKQWSLIQPQNEDSWCTWTEWAKRRSLL